jgi:diguanylate cyclase (GGDEF)-like protein/PAS domain S-box-containing protein
MKGEKMKKDFCKSALKEAPVGYACCKIICNETGKPCDYEYVDMNRAFTRYSGAEEEMRLEWISVFGEIALNGGEKEMEAYSGNLGGWFRIKVFSPEKYYFILFIHDALAADEGADEPKSPDRNAGKTELKYKGITEEKENWERRLYEIADVLKLENDMQFQRIIENLPFALNIVSHEGLLMYANPKWLELYEVDGSFIGTQNTLDFWVEEGKRAQWLEALGRKGLVNDFEMHLRSANGREFWALSSGIIIQYQERPCIISTQIDITERKSMESALKLSEEKYRLLTEFTSDVIWILDLKKQKYSYVSPSVFQLTGYTSEEAVNTNLVDTLTPESAIIVQEATEQHLKEFLSDPESQKAYMLEARMKCKSGDVIWVEVSAKYRFNESGDIEIVGVSRNIEERKKNEREVLYLSYHDQLTGLYNRRFYEEELHRMNFRGNMPLAMVIADVNGLKLTNDAFGHFAGDDLLKKFTSILNKELRAEDVAARIGGDEFVLLLPNTDSAGVEAFVARIKNRISRFRFDYAILSVSFGWAVKETPEEDFEALFNQAEDNMYHKKLAESSDMKNETILLAMRKLFLKNSTEQPHSERVGTLCLEIGRAMKLSDNDLLELELLSKMHDIGKVGVQEEILNKPESLNETELLEIRRHPEIGYQILRSADEYVHIAEAVLAHHERPDGKGYPRSLKQEAIPLPARILAVAEAYDVMLNGSLYKDPMRETDAVQELIDHSGTQFDSEIVKIFIENVLNKKGA